MPELLGKFPAEDLFSLSMFGLSDDEIQSGKINFHDGPFWRDHFSHISLFFPFLERLIEQKRKIAKIQFCGPVTLAKYLSRQYQLGPELAFQMAFEWSRERLIALSTILPEEIEFHLVFDEPCLNKMDLIRNQNEYENLLRCGANFCKQGIHCCGEVPWEQLVNLNLKLIFFDFYQFSDTLLANIQLAKKFTLNEGILGLGLIPTHDKNLLKHFELGPVVKKMAELLTQINANQLYLTPACGLGNFNEFETIQVKNLIEEAATKLQIMLGI